MLNSYTLLRAMNGIHEDDILMAAKDFVIQKQEKHFQARRIITIALVAALIIALGATAYAVGLSIHRKRQEELRQKMMVDENNVSDYTEYDVPESGAADGGLTVLSAINNGDYQRFYFNISPVSTDAIELLDSRELGHDNYLWPYLYVDGEYYGILVNNFGPYSSGYDEASKTLTLQASIPDYLMREKKSVEISIVLGFTMNDATIQPYQKFGPASISVTEHRVKTFYFPTSVAFENPETDGHGEFIGIKIYAEGITWLSTHDDMESIYQTRNITDIDGSDDTENRWLSWTNCKDAIEFNAAIVFSDGSSKTGLSGHRVYYDDGVVHDIYLFDGEETINIDEVVLVSINGEVFEIS